MATKPTIGGSPAGGLGASLRGVLSSATAYLAARAELLRLEAGEAGRELAKRTVLLFVAAIYMVLFYVMLWIGLVGLAEMLRPGSWPIAAFACAVFHLLIAIIMLVLAKRPVRPIFSETIHQIKEDEKWLRSMREPPEKP